MQIKKISLNDYKAKNQNANDFRKRGAIDLFKSQIQNAVFRFKHNKGKKTKIMDFNFLFGQIQLILFDISTMFGYDCLFLSLYDIKHKHNYPKILIMDKNPDYESFYLEVLREINYIREIND